MPELILSKINSNHKHENKAINYCVSINVTSEENNGFQMFNDAQLKIWLHLFMKHKIEKNNIFILKDRFTLLFLSNIQKMNTVTIIRCQSH